MSKKRVLMSYYKKKYYKGKTVFARAVDFLALRLIAGAACYLWFTGLMENSVMAVILSVTATLAMSVATELYKSIRLDKFILREREEILSHIFRERLLLMPEDRFKELARAYIRANHVTLPDEPFVYAKQSASKITEDTVLFVYRAAKKRGYFDALIFTTAEVDARARELAAHCGDAQFHFITPSELMSLPLENDVLPNDDDIDGFILTAVEEKKRKRRESVTQPLAGDRSKRYMLVAIGLFAASFFVNYPLYYRLMSAVCISLGTAAWWLNNLNESGHSSLDKI